MNRTVIRHHVAAALLLAPAAAFLTAPAAAQQRALVAGPAIAALAVDADNGLLPGSTVQFTMRATPHANNANVTLANGTVVPLVQNAPGVYRGTYTVRRNDRIEPSSPLVARLHHGDKHIARNFSYPASFQAHAAGAPGRGPLIENFAMRGGRPGPGRELRFRLEGRPGGNASVDIPGVVSGLDLAEVRPGIYEGNYTVRRRDDPDAFERATATLRAGNQRMTARLERDRGFDRDDRDRDDRGPGRNFARDDRPPRIENLVPANGDRIGERGQVQIRAALLDEGSGVDPSSVRVRIDGRDVTRDARISGNEVQLREDLRPGRHTVEVSVRDNARNSASKTWNFDVVDRARPPERVTVVPSGPLPLQVFGPPNNAVVDGNGDLLLQGQTAAGATVRVHIEGLPATGGRHLIMDHTVTADPTGRFNITLNTRMLPLGTRYEVRFMATDGLQGAEQRMTVVPRQG